MVEMEVTGCNCSLKSHVFQSNTSTVNEREYLLFQFLKFIIVFSRSITVFLSFFLFSMYTEYGIKK